jgi:hypothetical protein
MGKKNRHLQPQIPILDHEERRCDWCWLPTCKGAMWCGNWLCSSCFPPAALNKKRQQLGMRRCDSCKQKTDEGGILSGRWLCADCCSFFQQGKKHNNKYSHFSKVGNHHTGGKIMPKPRRKDKKTKLKKIVRWVVVIEEISDGEL